MSLFLLQLFFYAQPIIFRHIFNMGGKSSNDREHFLRCLPIDNVRQLSLKFFHHQITANLP